MKRDGIQIMVKRYNAEADHRKANGLAADGKWQRVEGGWVSGSVTISGRRGCWTVMRGDELVGVTATINTAMRIAGVR